MSISLIETPDGLGLIDSSSPNQKPLVINFNDGKVQHRLKKISQANEALAKAFNLKKYSNPTVIDATAGLGQDAFILATLGCQVTSLERHPIIFQLLQDGLHRAADSLELQDALNRITLINTDSISYLSCLAKPNMPDIVYCDPMFPERKKSAQVKKNMQILQQLIGPDLDTNLLLNHAIRCAKKRVVVKRPKNAMPIEGPKPSFSHAYKTSRFDVYLSFSS